MAGGRSKRRRKIRFFRIFAAALGLIALALVVIVPQLSANAQEETRARLEASDAYWRAQNENNRLSQALRESNTEDFVIRTARRDYGYCLYGETIYVVANLGEVYDQGGE